ncbi:potassium-transporting ATPase subunit KdpC [Methylomicrobium lacus]|uniref:potassium-transporting ATPase subunit KdpC n=1 Tax=Methylomicrobium lacus TaxID=136992 RepID=UPI003CCBCA5F
MVLDMIKLIKPAVMMLLIWTLLTGVMYPALVTGLAHVLFPNQANGSILRDKQDKAVGSALIGQPFSGNSYFWGRPSATAPYPYNAGASSGSNLGPTNPALADAVKHRIEALQAADPENKAPVPVDLVTASGSGLDPHISPAAAEFQIKRIANARHIDPKKLQEMVRMHTEGRQWGFLGEPRINVLTLNLALNAMQ